MNHQQQKQHQNKNNKISHSNSRSTRFNSKSFDCKGLLLLILFSCIMLVRNTYTGLTFVMLLIMKPDVIFGFGHDHNSQNYNHNHVQDDCYVNDNEYHSTNMPSNNPKVSPSTYASSIQASTSGSSTSTSSSYNARRMDVVQKPHSPSMNKSSVPHYAIL